MVMPAIARTDWTVDMLDALPDDGQRYEIIDGELFVSPAPSGPHQFLVTELILRLNPYLKQSMLARVTLSPSDVRRPDRRRNRVQPDVFVVRLSKNKPPAYPYDFSDVMLIIEVALPSNLKYDYQTKRMLYLENGIAEYWILNPEARNISRWRGVQDPGEVFSEKIEWHPGGMPAPLVIDINELFEGALL